MMSYVIQFCFTVLPTIHFLLCPSIILGLSFCPFFKFSSKPMMMLWCSPSVKISSSISNEPKRKVTHLTISCQNLYERSSLCMLRCLKMISSWLAAPMILEKCIFKPNKEFLLLLMTMLSRLRLVLLV